MLVGILVGICEGGGVGISVGAGVGVKVSTETLSTSASAMLSRRSPRRANASSDSPYSRSLAVRRRRAYVWIEVVNDPSETAAESVSNTYCMMEWPFASALSPYFASRSASGMMISFVSSTDTSSPEPVSEHAAASKVALYATPETTVVR